jgi:hypothetical protein
VNTRLNQLEKILSEIKQSVVDTSSSVDWNSSKNFNGINGKLDLMAEYIVKMKEDVDTELNSVWDTISQSIADSNTSLSEGFSKNITIEQLLQQVWRLENKMEEVLNTFMATNLNWKLPKEIVDKYNIQLNRKGGMTDEEVMMALWIPTNAGNQYWLNQWMNEGMNMWMEEGMSEWMSEWLGEARPEQLNAPVDMQGIAEPEMPMTI